MVPPVAGQLALVTVQVLPAVDSVQADNADVPSDCVIVAPEIAVAPAESLVIAIVAELKSAVSTLEWEAL